MSNLYFKTEASVFCLVIIAFFSFFQMKMPNKAWAKLKYVYLFLFIGICLTILKNVMTVCVQASVFKLFWDIGYGLCYALSSFFWFAYAVFKAKTKKFIFSKVLPALISVSFGIGAYFSSKFNINFLSYLSVFTVIAVFVITQYDKVRTDNLTKLYNRYGMEEEIRKQLRQYAQNQADSFYMIACDLDNFKYINDTWGHGEGDRALILISAALLKVGKMFDSEVFRIGGDEFVIVTNTSEQGLALDIVETLKKELDSIDFRDDFDIKMSMGIALYDGVNQVEEILNSADKKLYEAKKNK